MVVLVVSFSLTLRDPPPLLCLTPLVKGENGAHCMWGRRLLCEGTPLTFVPPLHGSLTTNTSARSLLLLVCLCNSNRGARAFFPKCFASVGVSVSVSVGASVSASDTFSPIHPCVSVGLCRCVLPKSDSICLSPQPPFGPFSCAVSGMA